MVRGFLLKREPSCRLQTRETMRDYEAYHLLGRVEGEGFRCCMGHWRREQGKGVCKGVSEQRELAKEGRGSEKRGDLRKDEQ